MLPLITIIVPVYKTEVYLPKCLDSIIKQTYRNLEIIVIDDGSPDRCGDICDEYAKIDTRIKVFHTENRGLSSARNYGIEKATGEYLGFVDSDDWIEPDMFETLVTEIEKNNADIVNCGFYYEYPKQSVIESAYDTRFNNSKDLVKALVTTKIGDGVWNKIYRKTCFSDIAFPSGHIFEEYATIYKVFSKTMSAICIPKPLYHYRKGRKKAITSIHSMNNLRDYWLAHKARYDYFEANNQYKNDKELMNKQLYFCADAIARTWRWHYALTDKEKIIINSCIKEMQYFSMQYYPVFGMKGWPFYLRFSIFMVQFDNDCIYALLYYLCIIYKKIGNSYH